MIASRNRQKNNIIDFLILILYIVIHVIVAIHHEAWRDESQAWVIAKSASFNEILSLCASEGHPCLWFFFLKVCQITGFPFRYASLLSVAIMSIATGLFLWKSPFSLVTKTCVVLSPLFFYYNPVICRIYALLCLFIVLLCVCWPCRREKPILYGVIIAVLFQSHVLIAGLSIGCLLETLLFDRNLFKRRHIIGFGIPVLSLICMVFELHQSKDTESFIRIDVDYVLSRLNSNKIPEYCDSVTRKFDYNHTQIGNYCLWIWLALLLIFVIWIIRDARFRITSRSASVVSICGIMYYWGIIILIRAADHIQMSIVFLMILLFFMWTILSTEREPCPCEMPNASREAKAVNNIKYKYVIETIFMISCILMIPKSAWIDPRADIHGQFSGSLEAAELLEENAPERSVIVMHNDMYSTSIAAYLYESNKEYLLWDIDNGCEYTIHKWGRSNKRIITPETIYESICEDLRGNKSVYYVRGVGSLDSELISVGEIDLVGRGEVPNTWNEYYQIYRINI